MVAYTVAALIGQLAHRRLITDDGVTAAEVADFVIEFIGNGLRPRAAKAAELTAAADDLDEAVEP
jgi:hypothetical protein